MKLYHDGERAPHTGRFTAVDEEDCYSDDGRKRGVWLTSRPLDGPNSVSFEVVAARVKQFEVTADGDAHRTFVVPHQAVDDVLAAPKPAAPSSRQSA